MRTKNRKEDKMDTREEFVGKFELGNKVDITDPCYNKGAWCRMATDCRPGTWYGYATISDKGEWETALLRCASTWMTVKTLSRSGS